MDELTQFSETINKLGWPAVLLLTMYKTGMISIPFLKNGDAKQQNMNDQAGEFQSHVKEKLDAIDEKVRYMGNRLSRHLDSEEKQRREDLNMIDKRLSIIEHDIKNLHN